MCLIAFAIGASPRWPLVVASNRDEFLNRPTLALARWQTASGRDIISGRDERAGGTWLGMTPDGRIAFLTNVRQAGPQAAPLSRGELVMRWLETDGDPVSFAAMLWQDKAHYAGFNLVLGDIKHQAWMWLTNTSLDHAGGWHQRMLEPGVYGLSNAALDTPWPKTLELKRALAAALSQPVELCDLDFLQRSLWTALGNRKRAPAARLPATGVSRATEAALSSAFVEFPAHGYGTRSSTLLIAGLEKYSLNNQRKLQVDACEQTYLRLQNSKTGKEIQDFSASMAAVKISLDF